MTKSEFTELKEDGASMAEMPTMVKNTTVANATLTEQWKNGELQEGLYYVSYKGEVKTVNYIEPHWTYKKIFVLETGSEGLRTVDEVLARVPTYEEHQAQAELIKELVRALDVSDKLIDYVDTSLELIKMGGTDARICKKPILTLEDRMPENVVDNYFSVFRELKKDLKRAKDKVSQALTKAKECMK